MEIFEEWMCELGRKNGKIRLSDSNRGILPLRVVGLPV